MRAERWIALGLFFAAFTALFATERAVGFPRDESVYFAAAQSYAGWFELLARNPRQALTDEAIVRAFDFNHEHPALLKSLFGLSHLVFHQKLGWLRPAAAFRLPAFAFASLIPALVFLLGSALYGRRAGLFAALSFFLVPRQYFNAELACFDMPVAAMWLLTVYGFWRAQTEKRWWLWTGVFFGLALATKHNAFFLPIVLTPLGLWRAWRPVAASKEARQLLGRLFLLVAAVAALFGVLLLAVGPGRFWQELRPLSPHTALLAILIAGAGVILSQLRRVSEEAFRPLATLGAMAVLGPAIFLLHWPFLWHAPVERITWYLAFHAQHNHYAWYYLGEVLRAPPFPLAYVLVKTALTVPASLFVPIAVGFFTLLGRTALGALPKTRSWTRLPSWSEALVLANAIASIAIISHPQVPHFGGVKHWFPSMPFLAILGGYAVAIASQALFARRISAQRWATGALFGLLFAPALVASVRIFPYGTAYYSELAGGLPGAASLGMQRQFWSSHVTGVFDWLNQNAPKGARVYLHEVNGYSFRDYQRNKMLREDLVPGGPSDSQLAAYQYHQEFREQEFNLWQAFGTTVPVAGLYVDETPQVIVYRRP